MPMSIMSVQFVQSALEQCGVPLPAEAQTASDTLLALQAEASRDVVTEALDTATTSRLTPKNAGKRVQDLAVALTSRERAVEAAQHLERPVLDQFRQAIADNTDELIIAMRPLFDHAAAVFQTAGTLFEPGISEHDLLIIEGRAAVESYQHLDDAGQWLTAVNTARIRVLEMSGGYVVPDASWYIEGAANTEALSSARMLYKRGWHHLTRAGFTLRLNTPAEAASVVASAERTTGEAATAAHHARVQSKRDPLREAAIERTLNVS